jgi:hypothetical protein
VGSGDHHPEILLINLKMFNMKTVLFLLFAATFFTTAHAQPIGVVTSKTAYVFYQGRWVAPKQLDGTDPQISSSDKTLGIMTNSVGYAFSNGQWGPIIPLSGYPIGITSTQGVIGIMTSQYCYVFYNGQWRQQLLSGTPKTITSKNSYLLLTTNSYSYVFDINTNKWFQSPALNGTPVDNTH